MARSPAPGWSWTWGPKWSFEDSMAIQCHPLQALGWKYHFSKWPNRDPNWKNSMARLRAPGFVNLFKNRRPNLKIWRLHGKLWSKLNHWIKNWWPGQLLLLALIRLTRSTALGVGWNFGNNNLNKYLIHGKIVICTRMLQIKKCSDITPIQIGSGSLTWLCNLGMS